MTAAYRDTNLHYGLTSFTLWIAAVVKETHLFMAMLFNFPNIRIQAESPVYFTHAPGRMEQCL